MARDVLRWSMRRLLVAIGVLLGGVTIFTIVAIVTWSRVIGAWSVAGGAGVAAARAGALGAAFGEERVVMVGFLYVPGWRCCCGGGAVVGVVGVGCGCGVGGAWGGWGGGWGRGGGGWGRAGRRPGG